MTTTEASPAEIVSSVLLADDAADLYVSHLVASAPPLDEDQAALVGAVLGDALRGRDR